MGWLRQRRPQLVSRAPHSTRPRSPARDDDSSGLERLQTPGHLLREGGVSVASSQSMARRATPQASRSNVDFVWPASRPRLTERDGDDEAAGSADVMGTRRLTLECRNGTSRRPRESRMGGSRPSLIRVCELRAPPVSTSSTILRATPNLGGTHGLCPPSILPTRCVP